MNCRCTTQKGTITTYAFPCLCIFSKVWIRHSSNTM